MVTSSNFIKETIIFIRNDLRSNIVDPISSSRPSGQQFVLTSYPDKPVVYPIITVRKRNINIVPLGEQSNTGEATIQGEVRVWARNEIERDDLAQKVIHRMTTNQYPASTATTSLAQCLYDFSVGSTNDIDETGKQGVKSTVINIEYKTIITS